MAENKDLNLDFEMPAAPSLTLDPTGDLSAPAAQEEEKQPEPPQQEVQLSPEEQKMVDDFAAKPARRRSAISPRQPWPRFPPRTWGKWAA